MPSARPCLPARRRAASVRRGANPSRLGIAIGSIAAVAVAASCLLWLVRPGNAWLHDQAEIAVARLVGAENVASIGAVGLSFDPLRGLVIELDDTRILDRLDDRQVARIERLQLGVAPFSLLGGMPRLRNAHLGDIHIDLSRRDELMGYDVLAGLRNGDGLVDPRLVTTALFEALHKAFDYVERSDTDALTFGAIMIETGRGEALRLEKARLYRAAGDMLGLEASMTWRHHALVLSGTATRPAPASPIDDVRLELDIARDISAAGRSSEPAVHDLDSANLSLSGREGDDGGRITLTGEVRDMAIRLGKSDPPVIDARFEAVAGTNSEALVIESLHIENQDNLFVFEGNFLPLAEAVEGGGYRFSLVSEASRLSPGDSPEAALDFTARLGGLLTADHEHLVLDEIVLGSETTRLSGRGNILFAPGKTPGIELRLTTDAMPVAEVKQIWPWFAAGPARQWVLANLAGGRISGGAIEFAVPPGRLGNGVPLNGRELAGRFGIIDTRFNVAGDIPAVEAATGEVAFRGYDVDIALRNGTVSVADGRVVDLSNGSLALRQANIRPVIGELALDIEGEASDVLQLASYRPIDAGRFVDFAPSELAGRVRGTVNADIPLHGGIPIDTLAWDVALDFENVALTRPLEGQFVTEASGRMHLDRRAATINAKARLNGAPADIALVEPIGASEVRRHRHIAVVLDDAARAQLLPGLDNLLRGSTRIELTDDGNGPRRVRADIGDATLSLPWIGWQKGRGVPATIRFSMDKQADGLTRLDDMVLEGEPFAAAGSAMLDGRGLQRLSLSRARLNRQDEVSIEVARNDIGHSVVVRGERLDARSAIKMLTKQGTGTQASGEGAGAIRLDLQVAQLAGFHGEVLRDAVLDYRGTGRIIDTIDASARTASGQVVGLSQTRVGGVRNIALRSGDAGAVLRFMDIYERVEGGRMSIALAGRDGEALRGAVEARDFHVVDEPRLASIAGGSPQSNGPTLNEATGGRIDASRVFFDTAYTEIEQGSGYLNLEQGILRGPVIGASYRGMIYDRNGRIAMTGTFMPAYGINRVFGALPLIGPILGNGRDGGLIGITFRLDGETANPQLQINPLSAVAPGIFRSVFEYR